MRATLALDAVGPFDFARTAYSHGWVVLSPNAWDPERRVFERVHRLSSGEVVRLEVREGREADVEVAVHARRPGRGGEPPSPSERDEVAGAVRRMLRLDEDLSAFYARCEEAGGSWAAVPGGLGRLLRSPTVFEDVVKTILTTNVQWGGTKRMVRELVQAFGDPLPGPDGGAPPDRTPRAFPTPEAIAEASAERFAEAVGLGYRAPYVYELARRVASGELELEGLAGSDLPTAELERELRAIKGVGPYAAATLLMLLGRYDVLPVDSVFRDFVRRRYFDGAAATDDELRAVYEPWGRWKVLAYWFDLWEGLDEEL